MRSGLAVLGRKQPACDALAGRALREKRQRILQSGKDLVRDRPADAAAGFGYRHEKQADQAWRQQQRALPSPGGR
jgi:hypothetical protein